MTHFKINKLKFTSYSTVIQLVIDRRGCDSERNSNKYLLLRRTDRSNFRCADPVLQNQISSIPLYHPQSCHPFHSSSGSVWNPKKKDDALSFLLRTLRFIVSKYTWLVFCFVWYRFSVWKARVRIRFPGFVRCVSIRVLWENNSDDDYLRCC